MSGEERAGVLLGYYLQIASSVGERDGLGLELCGADHHVVAEVFRDDDTGSVTMTWFDSEVPVEFEVVTWFVAAAQGEFPVTDGR